MAKGVGRAAIAVTGLCFAGPAIAAGAEQWNCRNTDFEVGCSGEKCEVSDSFTPMDIQVSADELSICAYTGCWEGKPLFVRDGPHVYTSSQTLKWSHNESVAGFQVIINTESKLGSVVGEVVGILHCSLSAEQ